MTFKKEVLKIPNEEMAILLFGKQDSHLKQIEDSFQVQIVARGTNLFISGKEEEVARVISFFRQVISLFESGNTLTSQEILYAIHLFQENGTSNLKELYSDVLQVTFQGKRLVPKTLGQKVYVDAIRSHDIVFCIGPAGTGKTYLAMVMAVRSLLHRQIKRIILTRPAIEAGEKLGFLPGDLQEKVDPYLRPLYDALYDILGSEKVHGLLEKEIIEVAPLAYMRGRTLDDSFIILDEAQNTTKEQMKMFLTRLGFHSKAIITGDITQIDLPHKQLSGLIGAQRILKGIKGISFVYLSSQDVVRHPLVQDIIDAYETFEEKRKKESKG